MPGFDVHAYALTAITDEHPVGYYFDTIVSLRPHESIQLDQS